MVIGNRPSTGVITLVSANSSSWSTEPRGRGYYCSTHQRPSVWSCRGFRSTRSSRFDLSFAECTAATDSKSWPSARSASMAMGTTEPGIAGVEQRVGADGGKAAFRLGAAAPAAQRGVIRTPMVTVIEAVIALVGIGLTAWEWRMFWRLDAQAIRTMLPVFRQGVDQAVWSLVRSADAWGYRSRPHGDAYVLVRPVSRLEGGPSAGPFLFALASISGSREAAQLTAYLPTGPLVLVALAVFASVAEGLGGAIWGLLILGVAGFALAMELNEARLCFMRLRRLAVEGRPIPLSTDAG